MRTVSFTVFIATKTYMFEHFTNHFHTWCTQNLYIHTQMEAETVLGHLLTFWKYEQLGMIPLFVHNFTGAT